MFVTAIWKNQSLKNNLKTISNEKVLRAPSKKILVLDGWTTPSKPWTKKAPKSNNCQ